MNQLTLLAPRQLEWRDAPAPTLPSQEAALVRPVAAATCDFDHLVVHGRMQLPLPFPIGHELVAEVVEVGEAVSSLRPGDVVAVPFQISCGACDRCRIGLTSACERMPWLSCFGLGPMAGDWGGAVADLLAVPWADAMLVPLPEGVRPVDAAATSCNLPDALRAVGPQLEQRPGASVLVTGGAFANISHYSVALARALGAGAVDYLSDDDEQAARAEKLGARAVGARSEVESEAYDIVVDNSQDPELLALAIRATRPGGELTSTTMYPSATTAVPLMDMFSRCITYRTGQPHVRALLDDVLTLVQAHRDELAAVTTSVVDWAEAPAAFGSGTGKTVVVRQ